MAVDYCVPLLLYWELYPTYINGNNLVGHEMCRFKQVSLFVPLVLQGGGVAVSCAVLYRHTVDIHISFSANNWTYKPAKKVSMNTLSAIYISWSLYLLI